MNFCRCSRKAVVRTSTILNWANAVVGAQNVWTYPGASSLGSDARRGLQDHPTVKPTAMLEDALLDLTNRADIVIDPFLGSGSTLIAADKTGRVFRGVELDPLYVDVSVGRYEATTGHQVVLIATGEVFREVAARRAREAAPV
jgi:DNA modification methylase